MFWSGVRAPTTIQLKEFVAELEKDWLFPIPMQPDRALAVLKNEEQLQMCKAD